MGEYMTIEQVVGISRLSGLAVSHDGTKVAWVESATDWDKNEYRKRVQVHDSSSQVTLAVFADEGQSHAPSWSVSDRLAYLASVGKDKDKADQIFIWTEDASHQVTHVKSGVVSFKWAPDGEGIYYLAPGPKRKDALKRREERYGDFVYEDKDHVPNCLFYQQIPENVGSCVPKDLRKESVSERKLAGDMAHHIIDFAVSPNGARIVLLTAPSPNLEVIEDSALYLLDVGPDGSDVQGDPVELPVKKPIAFGTKVLFSPLGDEICYTRPVKEGKWFNVDTLEVLNIESGEVRRPLASLDEVPYPVAWTERGLFFTLQQKTDWYVCRLKEDGQVEFCCAEPGSVTLAASVSDDGRHLAVLTATQDTPFEVFLDGARITNQARHFVGKTLSRKEIVRWNSSDGTPIEGVLITPPDLDESRSHPLLVLVHGGPTWAAFPVLDPDRYYPGEQFTKRGFIMLDVNYRGSSGYGDAFRKLNYRNLGLGDCADVESGVDMLVERGLADPERVGIMGWSQGGYISAMCTTYSRRFKAISVGAGISSWYTYYVNTDIPPFTRHYLGDTPWVDKEIYDRTSPITYVKNACTPTLIQHGGNDNRVPYPNAKELYRGLKDMGVPVQFVTFKGMAHGADKPGLHRAIMWQNYTWFCHHLLGDSLDGLWLEVEEEDGAKADREGKPR